MSLEFMWADKLYLLGQLLAIAFLGYGAWSAARYSWKHGIRNPLEWKSADFPIPRFSAFGEAYSAAVASSLRAELGSIEGLLHYGLHKHCTSGNGVIDAQHQRLFDSASSLRAAILSGQSMDEVNPLIDTFVRDMVQHFQDEEAFLAGAAYPGTAQHAALHRELINGVGRVVDQFRAGLVGINELFRFMAEDVLGKHALDADREFIAYLPKADLALVH